MFSNEDIDLVLRRIREQAGLVFDREKRYLVENRVGMLARARNMEIESLLRLLREGDAEIIAAVTEAMTIQETYFFRDPWLFDSLRDDVIPALVKKRSATRSLRIWCAACATGQEVWSVILLLRGMPELAGWDIQMIGSDISMVALERARAACYSLMEVNRGLPARELALHFRRKGVAWEVMPDVRAGVSFRQINLVGKWPELPLFDIVLLRNVLIYFDEATRRSVLSRMREVMQPDGYLFMGGAESPMGIVDAFHPGLNNKACYYSPSGGA